MITFTCLYKVTYVAAYLIKICFKKGIQGQNEGAKGPGTTQVILPVGNQECQEGQGVNREPIIRWWQSPGKELGLLEWMSGFGGWTRRGMLTTLTQEGVQRSWSGMCP